MRLMVKNDFFLCVLNIGAIFILSSCSVSKQISKQATSILLNDSTISQGEIGVSIYEPATNQYWYNYAATKYFVPASNTKLFTLYAGMKYLGDSLIGLRYMRTGNDTVKIYPSGDPSFLHPDYKSQPVFDFLKKEQNIVYCSQLFNDALAKGWAWDDYLEDYMIPRSEFPVYYNLIRIYNTDTGIRIVPKIIPFHQQEGIKKNTIQSDLGIYRPWDKNEIFLTIKSSLPAKANYYEVPMIPHPYEIPLILSDTVHQNISFSANKPEDSIGFSDSRLKKIYSRPADSVFKPMMYNSDNFFAEQTLLMASNEHLGYISDEKIIDTLLNTDLKDIPQKPNWVDGSGLSRYNLFTPQSFIYILNKLKNEFGLDRLKNILPTGGTGTITSYYKKDAGFIFAKTGTLSNHCALSGFLITKKNKLLIFSILANNYQTGATPVRRAIERFLEGIREKY